MQLHFKGVSSESNDERVLKHVRRFYRKYPRGRIGDIPLIDQNLFFTAELDEFQLRNLYGNIKRIDCCINDKGDCDRKAAGKRLETLVEEALNRRKITYKTEKYFQSSHGVPTPDFVLSSPLMIFGNEVNWIECKNYYGTTIPRLLNRLGHVKAARRYKDWYGPGLMIFGFGFNAHLERVEDVLYADVHKRNIAIIDT